MTSKQYYNKATENAKEFRRLVDENCLEKSILKLMDGFRNSKTVLTQEEIEKIDNNSMRDFPSWGEINGY